MTLLLKLRVLIALTLDGAFDDALDRALDGHDRVPDRALSV